MSVTCSLLIGYLLGSLNPAMLIAKRKKVDIRHEGTKNPGASNALLLLGKSYGALVMVLDITKAVLASKLAKWLFPQLYVAGMLAGLGAVIGHVFPFYMHFQGGKGLAALGGMAFAWDPLVFLGLLTLGVILMLIVNYSFVMPMSAAVLFPIIAGLQSKRLDIFLVAAAASALVIVKHWSNIGKARRGEELQIRKLVSRMFGKKAKESAGQ